MNLTLLLNASAYSSAAQTLPAPGSDNPGNDRLTREQNLAWQRAFEHAQEADFSTWFAPLEPASGAAPGGPSAPTANPILLPVASPASSGAGAAESDEGSGPAPSTGQGGADAPATTDPGPLTARSSAIPTRPVTAVASDPVSPAGISPNPGPGVAAPFPSTVSADPGAASSQPGTVAADPAAGGSDRIGSALSGPGETFLAQATVSAGSGQGPAAGGGATAGPSGAVAGSAVAPAAAGAEAGTGLAAALASALETALAVPVDAVASASAVTPAAAVPPVSAPALSGPAPALAGRGEAIAPPFAAGAPKDEIAESGPASPGPVAGRPAAEPREPLRLYAEWSDQGVSVWVGADAGQALPLNSLVQHVQRWLSGQGERLRALVCNGRPVSLASQGAVPDQPPDSVQIVAAAPDAPSAVPSNSPHRS